MHHLKIKNYQEFNEQEAHILWLLKHHLINNLKESVYVEFHNNTPHTRKFKIILQDEIYRTVSGRVSTGDLLDKIVGIFKKELGKYSEDAPIRIRDISITIEETNDLAGNKYHIIFKVI